MPRKLRYNIIQESPKDVRTNAETEDTMVGSMTRGAQISREQPRDSAPPFSSSANSAPASRINEPFRSPRNDRWLAPSNYDLEADEVGSFEDHIDDLFAADEAEGQNNDRKHKDTDYWKVTVIEDGVRKRSDLSVKDAIALPSNTKIILSFNKELQPIGQAAGLLSDILGSLGADYSHLPICEESWKYVNKAKKEHAYDMVKEAIANIESQDEFSKNLSQNDSLAQVLGKEHPGRRVHALGAGPCPTQVFGNAAAQLSGSGVPNKEYERRIAE
ncbi:hypothetical protein Ahy_B03g064053 [Arachis hypogaea]|uniref:Uncharacterized protein n=1 Tax=Arachis hypogaea TaxID=3818 RepID=A0A444ZYQ4_ARAHY|nr:hypothetical protein Ahy_B03g064053 [Arachis hypogaea]